MHSYFSFSFFLCVFVGHVNGVHIYRKGGHPFWLIHDWVGHPQPESLTEEWLFHLCWISSASSSLVPSNDSAVLQTSEIFFFPFFFVCIYLLLLKNIYVYIKMRYPVSLVFFFLMKKKKKLRHALKKIKQTDWNINIYLVDFVSPRRHIKIQKKRKINR